MKSITVRITREFEHRLRVWAAEMDMSRADLVREALEEKMDRLEEGSTTWQVTEVTSVPQHGEASACETDDEGLSHGN
jgi:predicted DNA-binding protein